MKQISLEQQSAIINLLEKYNVGVQDVKAVIQMFQQMPPVEQKVAEQDNSNIPNTPNA